MPRIIIAGHRRSGTTWSTQLVGELIQATLVGFLNRHGQIKPFNDRMWTERVSSFKMYKSHYAPSALQDFLSDEDKVIILVRNPWDTFTSCWHYFRKHRLRLTDPSLKFNRHVNRVYTKMRNVSFSCVRKFANEDWAHSLVLTYSFLFGSQVKSYWLKVSWKKFYSDAFQSMHLIIRYEDLRQDTRATVGRMLEYLEMDIPESHINAAIQLHSLQSSKKSKMSKMSDGNPTAAASMQGGRVTFGTKELNPLLWWCIRISTRKTLELHYPELMKTRKELHQFSSNRIQ